MINLYMLCNQTVTIYNAVKQNGLVQYRKTVIENGVYMGRGRSWSSDKTGTSARSPFLLVIPQGAGGKTYIPPTEYANTGTPGSFTLKDGDKVMPGVGPDVNTPQEWNNLSPVNCDGVVTVKNANPVRGLTGEIVHVEAGA